MGEGGGERGGWWSGVERLWEHRGVKGGCVAGPVGVAPPSLPTVGGSYGAAEGG